MAEPKTKPTNESVADFLNRIPDAERRDDCFAVAKLMEEITGEKPKMWGPSIVGFGSYRYKYESGHEGESCLTGFSPRKQNITIYVMPGFAEQTKLLSELGKHKAAKGCLYIKKLEDIDVTVLESLIRQSIEFLKTKYTEVK